MPGHNTTTKRLLESCYRVIEESSNIIAELDKIENNPNTSHELIGASVKARRNVSDGIVVERTEIRELKKR